MPPDGHHRCVLTVHAFKPSLTPTEIFLVTPPESAAPLETALTKNSHLKSLPKKPLVIAPEGLTHTSGTADIFRSPEVVKAIVSDFVVLPCDLISELDGSSLLHVWFTSQSGLGDAFAVQKNASHSTPGGEQSDRRGGLGVYYPAKNIEGVSVKKEEHDLLATTSLTPPTVPPRQGSLRPNVEQVVMSMPAANVDDVLDPDGDLPIRHSLLQKHGRVKLKSTHKDAHVYFFAHWVLQMMQNPDLDTVSEDVIGWWAKAQWQPGLADKLGLRPILATDTSTPIPDTDDRLAQKQLDGEIDLQEMSSTSSAPAPSASHPTTPASRVSTAAETAHTQTPHLPIPPLYAYIQPIPTDTCPQPLIHRADTTAHLLNISLHLAKQSPNESPQSHATKNLSATKMGPQSRVNEPDSLIAENVAIDARVSIRESVVGSGSSIASGARLTRCVVMENVSVGPNVTLTGCVLGKGCSIPGGDVKDKDKTRLTDCEVQNGFVVEWGTEAKGREFVHFEALEDDGFGDGDE